MTPMGLLLVGLIGLLSCSVLQNSEASYASFSVKTASFLSPPISLHPGLVSNKFYYSIPFPRGHIALKSFDAEVVDENGSPVPLSETYLHHWIAGRYFGLKHSNQAEGNLSKIILVPNSGICGYTLGQYFGLGSETRRTATWVPDPYGIVVGNPKEIPQGYEERWLFNIHAIDTRGANDRSGCTECRCGLYNVTVDEYGRDIPKNYVGGLRCCSDQAQCAVKQGFNGDTRKLFLKYTVKWVENVDRIVPVKIYIFDVTDTAAMLPDKRNNAISSPSCKIEYDVNKCSADEQAKSECTDVKTTKVVVPSGGDIVYAVAHQHSGGIGSALYGEDGQELCKSVPIYGEGEEAGNEANYIVGMRTCYPKSGSIKVQHGEVLTLVSNYSSSEMHTGVMGLFYILVAEPRTKLDRVMCFHFLDNTCLSARTLAYVLAGAVFALVAGASFCLSSRRNEYEPLV